MRVINVGQSVSFSNDQEADALRRELAARGILLINLMSAPGSGKTTLLSRTIRDLPEVRFGVMEADIASEVDAERIAALGAGAVQVHTDGMCHMDAGMTRAALAAYHPEDGEILFLENVGNLICPAEYDTGAHKKVMILSIPEGDDKPLKYPLMFRESDVLIISKIDAAPFFGFDREACVRRARTLNPDIRIFPLSARTGEGMDAWEAWLMQEAQKMKKG